jgi:hypothetical protein
MAVEAESRLPAQRELPHGEDCGFDGASRARSLLQVIHLD